MMGEEKSRVTGALCKTVTLALAGLCVMSCGKPKAAGNMAGAGMVREYAVIPVGVSQTEIKTGYPASIEGVQDVEIRPRVSGFITKLCVDEGAVVSKGQALFVIDKVQFAEAVKAAEAAVKMAEASVATSQLTVKNKKDLAAQNIIGEYDLETAQNDLLTREANLAQAKAQLASAQQDLSYTTVTSPSAGVVGTIPFRVGSLVSSSSQVPLTVVSDISKMHVYFSLNEKELLSMIRKQNVSLDKIIDAMPAVELQLADGSIYAEKGKVNAVSGIIDKAKGTVQMRAAFPNANMLLRSGGTGSVLIPHVLDSIIMIPQKATYEIQDKKYVYLLNDSSSVVSTEIQIYPLENGKEYAVTSGLKPGDRIVVEGISMLRNGTKIQPITPAEAQQRLDAAKQQVPNAAAAGAK